MTVAGVTATIGSMVLHSLWLGALIGTWASACLWILRSAPPSARYRLAVGALAAMVVAPIVLVVSRFSGTPWESWIAAAWFAGLAASAIRIANSWRLVRRLRQSSRAIEGSWRRHFDECANELGLASEVRFEASQLIDVPCSVGIRRPTVIVPEGLLTRLPDDAVRPLAAHELAHVARRDYAWHLAQIGLETLLFYHPVAWWLSRRIHRERELCCDQMASAICEPIELAQALATVESERATAAGRAAASSHHPLLDRVRELIAQSEDGAVSTVAPASASLLLTLVGVGTITASAWATGLVSPPSQSAWAPWLAATGLGLMVGLRHAFEPDHLMAVATLVTRERTVRSAMRLGAAWGIGHTISLLVLGTTLAVARQAMPEQIGILFECGVALMITGMGVRALRDAWRLGSRGVRQPHSHGTTEHTHAFSAEHIHIGNWPLARRPLMVGLMHGLAGSGALTALAVASLPSVPSQIAFMMIFGLGSTAGMAAVAGFAGWPLARFVRTPYAMAALSSGTGLAAIIFGVVWGYPLLASLL